MTVEPSLWSFIINAGIVVKLVLLLLLAASITSWTMIFQRSIFLKQAGKAIKAFDARFWSSSDLDKLYDELKSHAANLSGLEQIFYVGLKEFKRLKKTPSNAKAIMEGTERAMRMTLSQEVDKLERNLSFLATVGSTSPYVGLFGTVWGIMTSFSALAHVQQATISMVAPGISEALIATAMGLFAAIPAVIAYNRFAHTVERLTNHYYAFQDDFFNMINVNSV